MKNLSALVFLSFWLLVAAAASWIEDPLAPHSWHLGNYGQKSFSYRGGKPGWDPGIRAANQMGYTGEGVRIAVSDTGLEIDHEDLSDNTLPGEHRNYNLSRRPWRGDPKPSKKQAGHGTSVAGLIAAVGGNGLGSRGVAYDARVAGFRYLYISNWNYAKRVDQANGNFDIFNYSYGYSQCKYYPPSSSYISQLKYGTSNLRKGKGALYVKSAGNDYKPNISKCDDLGGGGPLGSYYAGNAVMDYRHNFPYTIVVGALNANGVRSSYSSPGSSLWISAPGGEYGSSTPAMITTDLSGCNNGYDSGGRLSNCNYTSTMNGTSSAAPVTSGVIALMLEANPDLSWRDVKYILAKTADPIHYNIGDISRSPVSSSSLPGHVYMPGWTKNTAGFHFHNWYGFGGINAEWAVRMAENYTSPLGGIFFESGWTNSGNISLNIPDGSSTGVTHTVNVSRDMTIESVQIELFITHPQVSDVGVELNSPGGTKSVILPINSGVTISNIKGWILPSNAFYMENSQGNWTLKVIDGNGNKYYANSSKPSTGRVTNWKIRFFGH